jgi:hypothetical protein
MHARSRADEPMYSEDITSVAARQINEDRCLDCESVKPKAEPGNTRAKGGDDWLSCREIS